MPEILENVKCLMCGAFVQKSEAVEIKLIYPEHWEPVYFDISVFLCDLCIYPVDKPIPFIVTEKGRAESMRQPAEENGNA